MGPCITHGQELSKGDTQLGYLVQRLLCQGQKASPERDSDTLE